MVTMRTPGDDIDLVHGLLHSEGVITEAARTSRWPATAPAADRTA